MSGSIDAYSDEQLAKLFNDYRSERAMETLFRRHLPAAYSLARRYFHAREDAEEAASETFVRVFRSLRAGQFRGESSFRTWVLKIAANVCIERLRQPRLPTLSLDGIEDSHAPSAGDRYGIFDAVAQLPDPQRLVLTLCDIEGYSAAEAAAIMGRGLTATKSLHYRARRTLKAIVERAET
ncbi:MAG: sigma-70 family RNA polymerase sigma factor [Capsulimonadaceae bacterium]|nr:sigma-70 family RNA polymerase sigma factor [Capsulimonadaceae bacterium]